MPFMTNGKRDYKKEANWEATTSSGKQHKKDRTERNKARAMVAAKLGKAAIKGKDIDHKKPLSKGGTTSLMNLAAISPSKNRSFARNKNGSMK
jgi:5-methylcytosine-specific restriction endonuclease McrA